MRRWFTVPHHQATSRWHLFLKVLITWIRHSHSRCVWTTANQSQPGADNHQCFLQSCLTLEWMLIVHITTEDKSQMLVAVGRFCVQCKGELTGNCNSEANLIANSGPNNKTSCMVPAPHQHVSILMLAFSCKQCGVWVQPHRAACFSHSCYSCCLCSWFPGSFLLFTPSPALSFTYGLIKSIL